MRLLCNGVSSYGPLPRRRNRRKGSISLDLSSRRRWSHFRRSSVCSLTLRMLEEGAHVRESSEVDADRVFQGSIPALYDQHLGPMIFGPYADDLASRLADLRHGRILEIAAGTGVVTRALVSTLPGALPLKQRTSTNRCSTMQRASCHPRG